MEAYLLYAAFGATPFVLAALLAYGSLSWRGVSGLLIVFVPLLALMAYGASNAESNLLKDYVPILSLPKVLLTYAGIYWAKAIVAGGLFGAVVWFIHAQKA